MPTLTVQVTSGDVVVSDIFLAADDTSSKLADAAAAQLTVASSRCVLLSPSGGCVAHSRTPSLEKLADGDVITVLVTSLPRVMARRQGWAFAAVKYDGSAVTWWHQSRGGDSVSVKPELTDGVDHVVATDKAFAAVKQDGSVVTWGEGGNSDEVKDQLTSGVRHIFPKAGAFAAVKEDGSVVSWGHRDFGGDSGGLCRLTRLWHQN